MSLYTQFETNIQKEQDGVPVTFDANEDGTIPTFIVARTGGANQEWAKVLEEETAPYRRLMDLGKLPKDLNDKILIRTFCRASLRPWSNVQNRQNQLIEYSLNNAIQLMTELPNLFSVLQVKANNIASYQDGLETETKN